MFILFGGEDPSFGTSQVGHLESKALWSAKAPVKFLVICLQGPWILEFPQDQIN